MTLEEMLRGSPLNQQRMADDNAISLAGMLARQGAGTVRQEPSLMQEIGGAITDYAVPDRYLPSSVMEPRLDMSQLESLRGTPVDMADVPDPVPMLMDTMPMAGITAFHGSPHKFSKFDMSKIGTGEGAQAYGHGLYMAENQKVANEYANAGDHGFMINGKSLAGRKNYMKIDEPMRYEMDEAMRVTYDHNKGDLEAIKRELFSNAANERYDGPWSKVHRLVRDAKSFGPTQGNEYKVDIPDDQIAKMLDWDKPLSGQPENVRNLWEYWDDVTNLEEHGGKGGDFYGSLGDFLEDYVDESTVSNYLKSSDIPGIKYLDQGSRQGGQGTSNFVLFADDIAKILERNGQPIGDLAEGLKAGSKLPMDEASRMGRAKEQGFDTDKTWFRGTEKDYKRNKKDSFYSSDPEFAEQFTYGTGPISPVHAKGKIFDPSNKGSVNELIAKMDELNTHANANPYTDAVSYYPYSRNVLEGGVASGKAHIIEQEIVQQALKELGYDGTRLTEGGVENLMMFNPKNIRSKFAKFDPKKSKSGDILAGAGAGFLASQLLGQDRN